MLIRPPVVREMRQPGVTTPVLLILFLPFLVAVTGVTSLGSALLPLMWGWSLAVEVPRR